ncbi:hypothetical protein ACLD5J_04090 [Gardnerella leopoldii]|uniref:hypothetical protein n=1 Tax=Gardnerella leopoldii TaxID=2792978 RepID=UPI0039708146
MDIRVVRFEIFRTERGERQSRRLLIRRVKKKNRKISAMSKVINELACRVWGISLRALKED